VAPEPIAHPARLPVAAAAVLITTLTASTIDRGLAVAGPLAPAVPAWVVNDPRVSTPAEEPEFARAVLAETAPRSPSGGSPILGANDHPAPGTTPAATPTPTGGAPAATPLAAEATAPAAHVADSIDAASYIPGYRRAKALSLSPYAPQLAGFPGDMLLPFGVAKPSSEWTFKWNGFLNASLQASTNTRPDPQPGQARTVFHITPQTIDEYASFVGTGTVPGNWAALNLQYGNDTLRTFVSINTWNPSQPSTYYQIGSQYFINNAMIVFDAPPIGALHLHLTAGYFYTSYGSLSQYGLGIYQNNIVGNAYGTGEWLQGEYSLGHGYTLAVEHGIMGNRNGHVPSLVVPSGGNGGDNPLIPASFTHHAHLGLIHKGVSTMRAGLHYMTNWSQDDRAQALADDPTTRGIDESKLRDGRITVVGADFTLNHPVYGFFGAAGSYVSGHDVILLRGMATYGGDGERLTHRWWDDSTLGTGTLAVAALNYTVSLGTIVAQPRSFYGDGPDILINTGLVIAKSTTGFEPFNRVRHKYGLDVLYKFLPYLSAGVRGDRVVPNSRDSGETFHVVAARLVFKTDWQSRESVTLLYARWFYGPDSHPEASANLAPDRIDDQLLSLNVSMWW